MFCTMSCFTKSSSVHPVKKVTLSETLGQRYKGMWESGRLCFTPNHGDR